jgi:hypothetical protein
VCLTIENKKSHEENIQNYNDPLDTMWAPKYDKG